MMTPSQFDLIQRLSKCVLSPASYDKRFVRNLATYAIGMELSAKQAAYLEIMHYRYRRQLQEPKLQKPNTLVVNPSGPVDERERLAAWNEGRAK